MRLANVTEADLDFSKTDSSLYKSPDNVTKQDFPPGAVFEGFVIQH